MKRLFTILAIAVMLVTISGLRSAQAVYTIPDPCNGSEQRVTAPINVATATTTALVVPVSGTGIYVCSAWVEVNTAAATFQFEYGSGTACSTVNGTLTGVISGPTSATPGTVVMNVGTQGMATQWLAQPTAGVGNGLCVVTTGTSPGVVGYLTYVQG